MLDEPITRYGAEVIGYVWCMKASYEARTEGWEDTDMSIYIWEEVEADALEDLGLSADELRQIWSALEDEEENADE